MIRALSFASFASILALALAGCGDGERVREKSIEVQENTPLDQAKKLLEGYAKGQALGSETTSFAYLVTEIRKDDSGRADILEKGFAELQKPKVNVAAKAKEILGKIAPQGYPKG